MIILRHCFETLCFKSEISESSRMNSPVLNHLSDVMPHHGPLMTHIPVTGQ